ncbi:MAG: sulfatase-like hydrolase/transferase [Lentisphaeria bacterium]
MPPPPNILMICSDQHTPRVLGAAGDQVVATPHLDALAADGCRFDACYCNSPLCVPSRASFMTGRLPFRCEVLSNQDVLDSRLPTLAHVAVRGGYHAVLSGKMHFCGPDQRHGFLERLVGEVGAEALYNGTGAGSQGLSVGDLGNCSRPDPLLHVGGGGNPFVEYDQAVADSLVAWLARYATAPAGKPPFFLQAGFLLPHCPFIAPPAVVAKYRGKVRAPRLAPREIAALHPFHQAYRQVIEIDAIPEANLDAAAAAYYAMVELLDRNVGRLVDALKRNGLWEDTVVVYFSDHGEMLGQHGRWHKEAFYEDAARVPLIVRQPGCRLPPSVAAPCSLVDLLPTLCDWTGVRPPPGIDGVSLAPALAGNPVEHDVTAETYTWWPAGQGGLNSNRMLRRGPWKLSYYGAFDSSELFNLAEDPGETRNRADDPACAGIRDELAARLFADGWSAQTAREQERRLDAAGIAVNIREFREALRKDPLPVDCPDYWRQIEATRAWVEAEREKA